MQCDNDGVPLDPALLGRHTPGTSETKFTIGTDISNSDLKKLSESQSSVKSLELAKCDQLTEQALQSIATMNLDHLRLTSMPWLRDAHLPVLASLELVGNPHLTNAGIQSLADRMEGKFDPVASRQMSQSFVKHEASRMRPGEIEHDPAQIQAGAFDSHSLI